MRKLAIAITAALIAVGAIGVTAPAHADAHWYSYHR